MAFCVPSSASFLGTFPLRGEGRSDLNSILK